MTTKTARIIGLYAGERRNCQIVSLLCTSLNCDVPLEMGERIESEADVVGSRASLVSIVN